MTAVPTTKTGPSLLIRLIRAYPMELILAVLILILVFTAPGFASVRNLLNVLRTVSMLGIIAFGMTAVIIAGEIDLSVGAGAALAGCIVAWFAGALDDSLGGTAAVLIGVVVALSVGFGIGFSVGKFRHWFNVPSFICTLALFTALRGAANLITGGFPLVTFPGWFSFFGGGYLFGIPFPVYVFAMTFAGMHFLMNYTRFGRAVYAVGGNMEAARAAGINPERTVVGVFALHGMFGGQTASLLPDARATPWRRRQDICSCSHRTASDFCQLVRLCFWIVAKLAGMRI